MSNKHEKELADLLCSLGGELIRERKHRVYRLRNGRKFTLPHSPSDQNWARIAKSELRRLATDPASFAHCAIQHFPANPVGQQRYRQRNWEPHERGDVIVLEGDGQPTTYPTDYKQTSYRHFTSVEELRSALGQVERFWQLGPCGRARVLMKIIATFQPYLAAIPILLQPFSNQHAMEFGALLASASRDERNALWKQLFEIAFEACGGYFLPALLIDDPRLDYITLVDVASLSVVSQDYDDVVLLDMSRPKGRLLVGHIPFSGEIDMEAQVADGDKTGLVLFWGFPPAGQKRQIDFAKDAEWFNSTTTRAAIKAILETDSGVETCESV